MTAVYVPPHADNNKAMDELYGVIDRTETSRPEAAFIVAGDFNSGHLRKVLPRYHQHISCPTRGENTLDHVHTPYADTYKALPHSPFGKSDHASVVLLPSYRQKLKRDGPVTRTIQQWSDQSDSVLRDCFSTTEWCVFKDTDINTYTDAVIGYIGKCIDDVVPRITVRTFPNQKPWVNGEKSMPNLKHGQTPYNSGDLEEYRKSRTHHTDFITKSARQRLFFLHAGCGGSTWTQGILCSFYRCTIESILTGCITAWYSSSTALNSKALQRVVKTAQHITRSDLPSMEDLYTQRCIGGRPPKSLRTPVTPATNSSACCRLAERFCSIRARTTRLRDSFIPQTIRLFKLCPQQHHFLNNTFTS
ncbi:hypothetical protein L3Q82_014676, partial [Scortum barcoo]